MPISRRAALTGAAALLGVGQARAATRAQRRFTILRDGRDVGRHELTLSRDGDRLQVDIDIEIVVRILGIAAYRYTMTNREIWVGGRLQSLDSRVFDDGRRKRVQAMRDGDALMIGSEFYNGPAPTDAATTTYFVTDFLKRGAWISTDSGEVYTMAISNGGAAQVQTDAGAVPATMWRATNGADFTVQLFYDRRGEWASVAFDAGGEPAIYRPQHLDDSFAAVWNG